MKHSESRPAELQNKISPAKLAVLGMMRDSSVDSLCLCYVWVIRTCFEPAYDRDDRCSFLDTVSFQCVVVCPPWNVGWPARISSDRSHANRKVSVQAAFSNI